MWIVLYFTWFSSNFSLTSVRLAICEVGYIMILMTSEGSHELGSKINVGLEVIIPAWPCFSLSFCHWIILKLKAIRSSSSKNKFNFFFNFQIDIHQICNITNRFLIIYSDMRSSATHSVGGSERVSIYLL